MMTIYHKVTPVIVEELESIVGKRNVIYGDFEQMEGYDHDEVANPHYTSMPEAVVKPTSAEEISQIMKLANRDWFKTQRIYEARDATGID